MAKAEYRSAIRSRKLIIAALADLLQEKPLDKITVTDVVNRAEINRGTFYAHYSDIPDVIHQMVGQAFCRIRDSLSSRQWPLEQLPGTLLRQIQDMLEEDLNFYRKLMVSSASAQLHEQLCNVIVEYLLEHESEYTQGDPGDFDFKIRFCAGGLSSLYQDWFSGKLNLTLDDLTHRAEAIIRSIM